VRRRAAQAASAQPWELWERQWRKVHWALQACSAPSVHTSARPARQGLEVLAVGSVIVLEVRTSSLRGCRHCGRLHRWRTSWRAFTRMQEDLRAAHLILLRRCIHTPRPGGRPLQERHQDRVQVRLPLHRKSTAEVVGRRADVTRAADRRNAAVTKGGTGAEIPALGRAQG